MESRVTMRIVGHTDYRTTINIYTHLNNEVLSKAQVNLEDVFKKVAKKLHNPEEWSCRCKKKTAENIVFSTVLSGTGDRIRTNDTPGMNRIL